MLALQATATAILLGTPVAIAITRYRFPGRGLINLLAIAPLFIPLVMSGLAILIFFSTYNLGGPAVRLFVAHVALTVPYIIRMVATSMAGFDWNQEMAARNLGASPLRAFIEIVLPQIMPGVIAGRPVRADRLVRRCRHLDLPDRRELYDAAGRAVRLRGLRPDPDGRRRGGLMILSRR